MRALLAKRSNVDPTEFLQNLAAAWIPHTILEEEILLPALRGKAVDQARLDEIEVERDVLKILLGELLYGGGAADRLDAKLAVVGKRVGELIDAEEKPRGGLFAMATGSGVDFDALEGKFEERNRQLKQDAERKQLQLPAPGSLRLPGSRRNGPSEEKKMPKQSSMRERDDQGRFMSDDDERGYRGSSRSNDRDRDDYGRFTGDDDDRGRRRVSRSGDRDEDDYRGRSRRSDDDDGRGWYGDREGHSEAARRGWEERQGSGRSRSSRYDDDDDRRRGRNSRYEDDDRRSSRGGGWFGDPEGHSEASRRGWDNPDHGDSGWYGDSQGHSEASRRGWEERGSGSRSSRSSGDYERRGHSRNYDDDDRRGSRRGRGQGGWFGNPEGHSEASRRGREDRR
jgi:hypothetical protein